MVEKKKRFRAFKWHTYCLPSPDITMPELNPPCPEPLLHKNIVSWNINIVLMLFLVKKKI